MSLTASEWRRRYTDLSKTVTLLAGGDPDATDVLLGKSGETIYVQLVTLNVATTAAVTIVIRDDASTPVLLATIPVSLVTGVHTIIDGGEEGIPLTADRNLDINGAAGYEGILCFKAYRRPTPDAVRNLGTVGARQQIVAN